MCTHYAARRVDSKFAGTATSCINSADGIENQNPECNSQERNTCEGRRGFPEFHALQPTGLVLTQRKIGKAHLLSALHRRLVRQDTDAGDVCGLSRIRERLTLVHQRRNKFMYEVRMGTTMPRALDEG